VVIDRKAEVGFRFGAERWIGLGANPEVEVQVTSQGGFKVFFSGGNGYPGKYFRF